MNRKEQDWEVRGGGPRARAGTAMEMERRGREKREGVSM
jgi:hypothetical protein